MDVSSILLAGQKVAEEEKESDCHLAHIPCELHNNVIELTSVPLDYSSSLTVMLGILTPAYSSVMWKNDVASWSAKFPNSTIVDIQLTSVRNSPNVLDSADAILKIKEALSVINLIDDKTPLRLILLGTRYASFIPKTIRYLLTEWKTQDGENRTQKKLLLVISNTTQAERYFKLCQQLCLTGACHSVQFYNTDYYYPFGYYHEDQV